MGGKSDKQFREDFQGTGKWAALAAWMNQVGRCLNNLRGAKGVEVERNTAGGFDFYSRRGGGGGGGEGGIPPAPNVVGIHLLVCISYDGEHKQYAWVQAPVGSAHNGYVPVLNHDPLGELDGPSLGVQWVDVSELRN